MSRKLEFRLLSKEKDSEKCTILYLKNEQKCRTFEAVCFFCLLSLSPKKKTDKMMNYRKGRNVEEELTRNDIPIENLPEDFLWMHVSNSRTSLCS